MTAAVRKIRVFYVDDNIAGAALMKLVIEEQPDMELVGSLMRAETLESEVARTKPDVVLLDLNLPGRDSLEAMSALLQIFPQLPVVVFSGYSDSELVKKAKRAGACAYVVKGMSSENVLEELRQHSSKSK